MCDPSEAPQTYLKKSRRKLRFGGGLRQTNATKTILGEGCNITQGLTNSATLALGSLVTIASIIVGCWLTLRALFGATA